MIAAKCKCGSEIKVPDRFAGKLGRCPHCGDSVRVPGFGDTAGKQKASAQCPACGEEVPAADATEGATGRCAACHSLYEVGTGGKLRPARSPDEWSPADDGSELAGGVRYKCAGCKTELESPSHLTGQQDKCPICGHTNTVPRRMKPRQSTRGENVAGAHFDEQHAGRGSGVEGEKDEVSVYEMDDLFDPNLDLQESPAASGAVGGVAPPAHPVETQWFYISGGEQVGPVPFAVLRDLVRTGHLQAWSMVWRKGMENWVQLGMTPEFAGSLQVSPPAPVTSQTAAASAKGSPGKACSTLSIVFGCIAFLFLPPFFGVAGLILGIIGTVQSRGGGAGVLGIVLSALGTIVGMMLGAAMWSS